METSQDSNTLLAIVQAQDADIAQKALKEIGVESYQMPSVGGFLGRKNVTLVIINQNHQEEEITKILQNTCSQRIEYIAVPLDSAPLTFPTPAPICVGGATIFGIDAEQIELL